MSNALPVADAAFDIAFTAFGAIPFVDDSATLMAEVHRVLQERGVPVARTLVGNYVTSLDMAGCSVTLCQADEELLRLWDAPVKTPGLRWGV